MIEKRGRLICIQCDNCNTNKTAGHGTIKGAVKLATQTGWTDEEVEYKDRDGKIHTCHVNTCPACLRGDRYYLEPKKRVEKRLSTITREELDALRCDLRLELIGQEINKNNCLEVTGMDYTTLRNQLNGSKRPTKKTVEKMKAYLGR